MKDDHLRIIQEQLVKAKLELDDASAHVKFLVRVREDLLRELAEFGAD